MTRNSNWVIHRDMGRTEEGKSDSKWKVYKEKLSNKMRPKEWLQHCAKLLKDQQKLRWGSCQRSHWQIADIFADTQACKNSMFA